MNYRNAEIEADNQIDVENPTHDFINEGVVHSFKNITVKSRHINTSNGKIDATNLVKLVTINFLGENGLVLSINDIEMQIVESFERTVGMTWAEKKELIEQNPEQIHYGLLNNNNGVIRANGRLNIHASGAITNEKGLIFSRKGGTVHSNSMINNKNKGVINSRDDLKVIALGPILNELYSKIVAKGNIDIESRESFFSNLKAKVKAGGKVFVQSYEKIDNTEGRIHSIGFAVIRSLTSFIYNQKGKIESEVNMLVESINLWNTLKGLIKAANVTFNQKEMIYNVDADITASSFVHLNAYALNTSEGNITGKQVIAKLGTNPNKNLPHVIHSRFNPFHKNPANNSTSQKTVANNPPAQESIVDENGLTQLEKIEGYLINKGGNVFGSEGVFVTSTGEIFTTDKGRIESNGELDLQAQGRIFNDYESLMSGASKVNFDSVQAFVMNNHKSRIKSGETLKTKGFVFWNLNESITEANDRITFAANEVNNEANSKIISTQDKIDFHSEYIVNFMSEIHAANGMIFSKQPKRFTNFASVIEFLADMTFSNLIISSWSCYQKVTEKHRWLNANAADEVFKTKYRTYIENGSDGQEIDGYIFYKPGTIRTNGSIHIKGDEGWFKAYGGNLSAGKEISLTTSLKYHLDDIEGAKMQCQRLCIKTQNVIFNYKLFDLPYSLLLEATNIYNYNKIESHGKIKVKVSDSVVQNAYKVTIIQGNQATVNKTEGWIHAHRGLTVRAHKIRNYIGKMSCIGKCRLYVDEIKWSGMMGYKTWSENTRFMWESTAMPWSGKGFSNLGGGPVEVPFSFANGSLKDCSFLFVDGPLKVVSMKFDVFGGFVMATQPSYISALEYFRNNFGRFFIIGDTTVKSPEFVNVMLFDTPASMPAYFNVVGKLILESLKEGYNISSNISARDGIWLKGKDLTQSRLPSSFINQTHPIITEVLMSYDHKHKGYVIDKTVGVYPQPLASISSSNSINVDLTGFLQNIGILHAPDINLNATHRVGNNLVRSSPFQGNVKIKSLPNRIPFIDILREQALDGLFQFSNNPVSNFVIEPVVPFSFASPLPDMLILHRPENDPPLETLKPMISPMQELWLLLLLLQHYGHTTYLPGIIDLLNDLRTNARLLHQLNPLQRNQNDLLQKVSLYYQVEEFHGRKGLLPVLSLSPNLFDPRLLQGTGAIVGNNIKVKTHTLENSAAVKANTLFRVKAHEMIVFTETRIELGVVNKKYKFQELTPFNVPEAQSEVEAGVIDLQLVSLSVVGAKMDAETTFKADVKNKAVVEALQTQEVIGISKKVNVLMSEFTPADITSKGTMEWNVGSLDVKGSALASINRLGIIGKQYVNIQELADQFISNWQKKKSFTRKSYSSNSIIQTQTVIQRSLIQSLMDEVSIEVPFLTGSASTLASGTDVKLKGTSAGLKGKIFRNENKLSSSHAAFFEVSHRKTNFDTNQIEPFIVVAGQKFVVEETKQYLEEGIIVKTGDDVDQQVTDGDLITKGLSVEQRSKTKGNSLGLEFFGSQMISQLINRKNKKSLRSLLQEDPLVARLQTLSKQQGNTEVFKNAVRAAIQTDRLVKQLNHNWMEAMGSRLGITDATGQFNPTISINFNHFKNTTYSKFIVPTNYDVGKGIRRKASRNQEVLDGAQFKAKDNVLFSAGNALRLKNGEETHRATGKSWGVGVSVQPLAGMMVGGSFHMEQSKSGETHHLPVSIKTPASIMFQAGKEIEAIGVNPEAGNLLEAEAPDIDISAVQDSSYSSSSHVAVSGSASSFSASFGSKNSHETKTVETPWIGGKGVNINATNRLKLTNVEPKAPKGIVNLISPQIIRDDLPETKSKSSFSLGVEYDSESDFPIVAEWDKGIIAIPSMLQQEEPQVKTEASGEVLELGLMQQSLDDIVTSSIKQALSPSSKANPVVKTKAPEPTNKTKPTAKKTPVPIAKKTQQPKSPLKPEDPKVKDRTARELMAENPRWAEIQQNIYQDQANARIVAFTVDALWHGVVEAVKHKYNEEMFKFRIANNAIKSVAYLHPTTKQLYIKTAEFVKSSTKTLLKSGTDYIKSTKVARGYKKLATRTEKTKDSLSQIYRREFLIPEAYTRRYVDDAFTTGLTVMPLGTLGVAAKSVAKLFQVGKLFNRAPAILSRPLTLQDLKWSTSFTGSVEGNILMVNKSYIISVDHLKGSFKNLPNSLTGRNRFAKELTQGIAQLSQEARSLGADKMCLIAKSVTKLSNVLKKEFPIHRTAGFYHVFELPLKKPMIVSEIPGIAQGRKLIEQLPRDISTANINSPVRLVTSKPRVSGTPLPTVKWYHQDLNRYITLAGKALSGGKKFTANDNILIRPEFFKSHQIVSLNQWVSMNPESLALRTLNQTVNIHNPQSFHGFISKIETIICNTPEEAVVTSLNYYVGHYSKEFLHALPDFTHVGHSTEALWIKLIQNKTKDFYGKTKIKYVINEHDNLTARINVGNLPYFVKEREIEFVIGEIIGLNYLKSLELQHLKVPELVAFGKYYLTENKQRTFILKTFLEGETLDHILFKMSQLPLHSPQRIALRNEMVKASNQAGKALAELQNKGLKYQQKPSEEQVNDLIKIVEDFIELSSDAIHETEISKILVNSPEVQNLFNAFRENPGILSNGLGDVHANQFVWSKKTSTLGFFDLESIPYALDKSQKPFAFVTHDYYEFLHDIFESPERLIQLSSEKIHLFQDTVNKGYFSLYTGEHTTAASEFFNFWYTMKKIHSIATNPNIKGLERTSKLQKLHAAANTNLANFSRSINPLASRNFVLINQKEPRLISTKSIEITNHNQLGTYNDTLDLVISKRSDRTTIAYIEWIKCTGQGNTANSLLLRAWKEIKAEAISNGSTKLQIEFHRHNNKALKQFHKTFEFQGSSPLSHFGETLGEDFEYVSNHRFKIPFNNPNASSFDDLYKLYNTPEYQLPTEIIKYPPIEEGFIQLPAIVHAPPLAQSTSQKTIVELQSHFSPEIQNVLNDTYAIINSKAQDKSIMSLLASSTEEIDKIIPDFTYLGKSGVNVWSVFTEGPNKVLPKVVRFSDKSLEKTVARITVGEFASIVKESKYSYKIIAELVGLDLTKSLNIPNLLLPRPIAIGKYLVDGEYVYFIIKTNLSGKSLDKMIGIAGKQIVGSKKREASLNKLVKPCEYLGETVAEIQNKSLVHNQKISDEYIYFWENQTKSDLKDVNYFLKEANLEEIEVEDTFWEYFVNDFLPMPGNVSHGIVDAKISQFTYSKTDSELGFVDSEMVTCSFDASGKPLVYSLQEYCNFIDSIYEEGFVSGLSLAKVKS